MSVTYHVVVALDRDEEGELKPRETQEVMSPIVAERRARALALEHAGALAFSRTGNPATGEFQDAVILARFGGVDLDSLGEGEGGAVSGRCGVIKGLSSVFLRSSVQSCLRTALSRERWRGLVRRVGWRMTISFARHQFSPEIIRHAVWLHVR